MKPICFLFLPILLSSKCGNSVNLKPYGATVPCDFSEVSYGQDLLQKYDICIPQTSLPNNAPRSLVVYIHGGGFIGGDKRQNMHPVSPNPKVASLLNDGIAFASLNYRLVQENDGNGMKKCIDDCVLAIQNILSNSTYNIDPNKVALWGSSAGAGISMLIGYGNILDIKAMYIHMPQATYDLQKWAGTNGVFDNCTEGDICNALNLERIKDLYGMGTNNSINCNDILMNSNSYRNDVDVLSIIGANDPPIWIQNTNQNMNGSYTCTSDPDTINHHKRHCTKLKNRVSNQGQEWHLDLFNQAISHGNGPTSADAITFLKDKI